MGIPTAPVITQRFQELVRTISWKKGMPKQRFTFVPHPVAGRPPELCNQYVRGKDPLTGRAIVDELVAALTNPLTAEEKKTGFLMRDPQPRLLEPNTPTALIDLFEKIGWTDGLPIILPTEAKVAEMLKGTSHKPDEIVGTMRPSPPHEAWEFNVEMVAANAVMAGAKPEYLPVILALSSTGVTSLFSSTTSFARMAVVNGPIITEIDMNAAIGAMSPLNKANATIGRAWTLLSRNLGGGAIPGQTYLGSQGNNLNYNNLCFAEREEKLPAGWKPFSEIKGFKKGESAVSTFTGWEIVHGGLGMGGGKEGLARAISRYSTGAYRQVTLLLDPIVASDLKEFGGFQTKESLSEWLLKNTPSPAQGYWRDHPDQMKQAKSGVEPYATWLKYPEGALIPASSFWPEVPVEIIVVGGETNAFMQLGDFRHVSTASVDKWR
jgi:hypothetical protein